MKSERRSAKETVHDLANEILARPPSQENEAKLVLIESIASRMSWMDLFYKIRRRKTSPQAHWTSCYDR